MSTVLSLTFFVLACVVSCTYGQSRCVNPNQRTGYCTSIYDCPVLVGVARQTPLSSDSRRFLLQAQCSNGVGRQPYVCCNEDTGYMAQVDATTTRPVITTTTPTTPTNRTTSRPSAGTGRGNVLPTPPQCGQISKSQKIYNGNNTELDEFSWMAILLYRERSGQLDFKCGGSLINQRYVLTAAHCATGAILSQNTQLTTIRLGEYNTRTAVDCVDTDCADPYMDVGVEEIIAHSGFVDTEPNRHNDIALVRLNREITYTDFIRPVCLPSAVGLQRSASGNNLVVAGWGRTLLERQSAIKQKLFVPINDQEACATRFRASNINIAETQLCAGGKFAEDSCDSDSGGPLMKLVGNNWALEGIVSFGHRCGLEGWPGVYTRVSEYENWIRSTIRA